ncbi:hypothetical protein WKH57_28315 [Niallia taxi]|uniref:hypothetical protein n=1 Tax=Niallia taxi TaxID=2499688 RepID=UPI00317A504E
MNLLVSFLVSFVAYLLLIFITLLGSPILWGVQRSQDDIQLLLLFYSMYGIPLVLISNIIGELLFKIGRARWFIFTLIGALLGIIMYVVTSSSNYINDIEWNIVFLYIVINIVIMLSFYIVRKKRYSGK